MAAPQRRRGTWRGTARAWTSRGSRSSPSRNAGRRGFTFTHRYGTERAQSALAHANAGGFTVNLSADSLEEADRLYDLSVGPVAVLLPHDVPDRHLKTPAGRTVVVCPAQTEGLTCLDCRLCAHPTRSSVVGFKAHGQFKKHVPELVQLRRQQSSTVQAKEGA